MSEQLQQKREPNRFSFLFGVLQSVGTVSNLIKICNLPIGRQICILEFSSLFLHSVIHVLHIIVFLDFFE